MVSYVTENRNRNILLTDSSHKICKLKQHNSLPYLEKIRAMVKKKSELHYLPKDVSSALGQKLVI